MFNMNFIKKIVDKKFDDSVHLQFQKFSKGMFPDRAIIDAKNSGGKYTIKTSPEFANELVRTVADKLKSLGQKTKVTGAIVSTSDLKNELQFKEIKQFQGVKRYLIDYEMSGDELINLLNKFPKTFFALTFSVGETSLKIKPKAPKSGKPGKDGEQPKADFCVLKTNDKNLAGSFVFENPNFKKAFIKHNFFIENIEIPQELKNSKEFAIIRESSKRVGKIIRNSLIDGKNIDEELSFSA